MKHRHLALLSIAALAACSSNPPPASPAPMPAPAPAAPAPAAAPAAGRDMSGTWDFSVDAGGQTIPGEMVVTRSGSGYGGTITPQGMNQGAIRSVTVTGDRMVMVVDSPEGEVTFNGTLTSDGRAVAGTLLYQGQTLNFTMRKR
jgi:hypothetical protein